MIRAAIKFVLLFLLLCLSDIISAQTVYITKTGKKYHADDCRYLSRSKIETTLSQAMAGGYTACSVCDPPTTVTTPRQSETPSIRRTESTQCTASTKAGNRCKRMTTNANGRCFQHQ